MGIRDRIFIRGTDDRMRKRGKGKTGRAAGAAGRIGKTLKMMSIHRITDITEADFGCEGHTDGPHALLIFEDGSRREVSEKWISENGIEAGSSVRIEDDDIFPCFSYNGTDTD